MTMLVFGNIFQPLISVFETVLKFFHDHLGLSWGLAIVALTICVRLVLVPLMLKQFHSMQAMQRLQPEMKKIQARYKDDKERQQQEMMKFYRENNINPMASCLPLVLQIPVFISLYYMLKESLRKDICPGVQRAFQAHYAAVHHVSLHVAAGQTTECTNPAYAHFYHGGASFLFIPDLTAQATGVVLIALLVLYVGTQLVSTMLMSAPTMDPTQRRLMMVLPLFFVLFIYRFPAGVIVYWITTNLWTMAQQYIFRRRIAHLQPVPAGGPPGAAGQASDAGGGDGGGAGSRLLDRLRAQGSTTKALSDGGNGDRGAEPTTARAKRGSARAGADGSAGDGGNGQDGSRSGGARGKPTTGVAARSGGPPPRPPRKKKKRSGRRR